MIDTHCHLFRSYYEDLDNLIVKLKENNIYCIVNGCEYFSNIESVELSNNDNSTDSILENNIYCIVNIIFF